MRNEHLKLERAKARIAQLRGFYIHAAVYVIINTLLILIKIMNNIENGESFAQAFFDFSTFITPFFWGIGLLVHGLKISRVNPFFSKEWEARQIKKYVDQDKVDIEKFK
ncbi:2TM domain-containing protein [Cellulophaga sp. Hel_I_12]|uniref:2TM domain-containing protein n=1 Tax=Cellulophaga sp. Hel_I_12 TaxID=1249972 RepID=UPI000648C17F|nr:2TM domain-containing protein [Cellulophaga sp. Hel_I_12]